MTVRRLASATLAMAVAAVALRALTGPLPVALAVLGDGTTLSAGPAPERAVLAVAGLLAWAVWAWGTLGLLLTAASGVPGTGGAVARLLSRVLLPAGLRGAAALSLGVGLVVATPAAAAEPPPAEPAAEPAASVPDWPAADGGTATPAPPGRPSAAPSPKAREHVVVPGDCLWRIAEDRLVAAGTDATDADVASAVHRWWTTNAAVIGEDPDLIHPGQVLRPPTGSVTTTSTDP